MISDYHLHTCFSTDSEASVSDVLDAAISKGMKSLCITDHEDMDYNDKKDFEINIDEYYPAMCKYKESYKDRIDLRIGVELGLQPHLAKRLSDFADRYPLDFVIGSTHIVNHIDPYFKEYWEGRSPKEAVLEYYQSILASLKVCNNFDVYGHLDYVTRYVPDKSVDVSWIVFQDEITCILKKLIASGKGIEINTGGLYKGTNDTNPSLSILRRYKELGGEIITVGSDAHKASLIGYGFEKAQAILKEAGFSYYTTFCSRKPEFHTI